MPVAEAEPALPDVNLPDGARPRRPPIGWLRGLALLTAGASLGLGLVHPHYRTAEGALTGEFVVPLAFSSLLAVLALFGGRGRTTALAWVAIGTLGQGTALQLVRAGPRIGYQRYAPLGDLFGAEGRPWLILLVAQAAVVLFGGRRLWPATWRWLRAHAGIPRLALLLAFLVLPAAVIENDAASFAVHLPFAAFVQLFALGAFVLAAKALDRPSAIAVGTVIEHVLGPRGDVGGGLDRFALKAAGYVLAASTLLGFVAYQWHPHVPDELVYLLHARYFADGLLHMPAPPVPSAFEIDLMTYEPQRWYSPVPPGWPAVLALGALVGLPWMVNPLLAAGSVLLTYVLLRRLYDLRVARMTTLLLCASPWFVFMSMNLMTHTLTLFAGLLGAFATERLIHVRHQRWAVVAGCCIGVLGWIRPLEGATVAALLALWVFLHGRGQLRLTGVAVMAIAAIATGALMLPYNAHLTGHATVFPIMAYTDAQYGAGTNALGFGSNRGLGWPGLDPFPGHGAIDVVVNAALNTFQVNAELLGWASGSLLPLSLLLLARRLWHADIMMLTVISAIVAVHSFYWFSGGPDFGARYWYLILIPCLALAVRGLLSLANRLEPGFEGGVPTPGGAGARVLFVAAALSLAALVTYVPWRATDRYHHYRGMRPDVRRLARTHEFGSSLVLVRGRRFPDYASAAAYNPIDLRAAAPIYAWDRDAATRNAVLRAYADRPVWILAGPTVTGRGFEIERGPIPAATLLQEEQP